MTRRTLLLPLLLTALCLLAAASTARAQDGDHRAALVVRFADGSVEKRCVAFSEPSITGAELLTRSGLQIIMDHTSGIGGAVCSIAGAGCAFPTQDCFCKCQGLTCEYWAYYHWVERLAILAGGRGQLHGALTAQWKAGRGEQGTSPPGSSRRSWRSTKSVRHRRPPHPRQRQPLRPRRQQRPPHQPP